MANITPTVAAPFIPEIWLNQGLEILRSNIVMAKRVARDTDLGQFSQGDILNVPYAGTFTAVQKAAGTAYTAAAPSGGSTTPVTLDQHWGVAFTIENVAQAQANTDLMRQYMEAAVVAIAEKIEATLLAEYANVTASVGTSGTDLTYAIIQAAKKQLFDSKAPEGNRTLVIASKDEVALKQDSDLTNFFSFSRPTDIAEGSMGRLEGFDIFPSQLVPVVAGTPNSTKCLAFHRDAFILAMRAIPAPGPGAESVSMKDPVSGLVLNLTYQGSVLSRGLNVVVDALWGTKTLRDVLATKVLT
jgi:hypothetical protein